MSCNNIVFVFFILLFDKLSKCRIDKWNEEELSNGYFIILLEMRSQQEQKEIEKTHELLYELMTYYLGDGILLFV